MGESLSECLHSAGRPGLIAFAAGSIWAIEITPDRPIVAQKSSFLAATGDVKLSVFFQKNLSSGFFGGEGFIMQKISGRGKSSCRPCPCPSLLAVSRRICPLGRK